MSVDLKGRDFLKLLDFSAEEIQYLIDLSADFKDKKKKGIAVDRLRGKNVALIFEKTSTRGSCLERPDQRISSDADACRSSDHSRTFRSYQGNQTELFR